MSARRIAAVHAASVLLDREACIARTCDWVRQAGRDGVQLLCFPEAFVPGFPYWINLYPPADQYEAHFRYARASLEVPGPDLSPVQEAARAAKLDVVLGVSERDGSTCYNTQVFIAADGALVGKHRKLQPTYAERMIWGQGDGSTLGVHAMAAGRIGGLICYEHMMNLARQALIALGMQIHCGSWPTFASSRGNDGRFDRTVEAVMRAHALTGQCFTVVAQNPVTPQYISTIEALLGPQDTLMPGGGWSAIFGPTGATLVGPHVGPEERLVIADIDLNDIARQKVLLDTAGHYSRPEVLRLVVDRRAFGALEEP